MKFRKRRSPVVSKFERSYKNRESLTEDEMKYISSTYRCPDCTGDLREGPSGGMSTNYKCTTCESKYNLAIPFFGQRISDGCGEFIDLLNTKGIELHISGYLIKSMRDLVLLNNLKFKEQY